MFFEEINDYIRPVGVMLGYFNVFVIDESSLYYFFWRFNQVKFYVISYIITL